jgi:glutamyl-tRNA reductase
MNLLLAGMNHRTAPLEVRERLYIQESRVMQALKDLMGRDGIQEGMIVSTCNRVEIVTNAEAEEDATPAIRQFVADYHHCDFADYESYFYWHRQRDAVRHLFRVASSLDSMVVGEPQILGQMKQAFAAARVAGALNGILHEVVNQALAVGRRVRRETALGTAAVSVSYAAVELARKIFGNLAGKTIFVIGAGEMSELAVKHLLASGASAILVTNRTYRRAVQLADAFRGTAIQFDQLFEHIDRADIIISSTGAPHFIITKDRAEQMMTARRNRPMFFVDIAVPRDIDPAVNDLDNAFVYDIDDLQHVIEANIKQRQREAVWAEEIVEQEVQKMMRRLASREVVPTIVALEAKLNRIREDEMERFRAPLSALAPEQRQAVEALTRGILNKVLHGPITELKSGAGGPEQSHLVQVIRRIFGVGE